MSPLMVEIRSVGAALAAKRYVLQGFGFVLWSRPNRGQGRSYEEPLYAGLNGHRFRLGAQKHTQLLTQTPP